MMSEHMVLIVEDDHDFAESLNMVFSIREHAVEIVHSGEEALDTFNPDLHSVILMDIRLPGINGVETLLQLRDRSPDLPILLMTGCERGSDEAVFAITAGATDLLFKPFKIKQMLDQVDNILKMENG
jgi:DNA-binding NtrC family response regulator